MDARAKIAGHVGAAALFVAALTLPSIVPKERPEETEEINRLRAHVAAARESVRQGFRKPGEVGAALERAVARVSSYVAAHPDLARGYFVRAEARMQLADLAGAEADLAEAVRLDPGFASAWNLRARLMLERFERGAGDDLRHAAARALRRGHERPNASGLARTADDDVTDALLAALRTAFLEGDRGRARTILERAHRTAPAEEYARWLSYWSQDPEEKFTWADEEVRIAPQDATARVDRAQAHAQLGDALAAGDVERARLHWTAAIGDCDYALEIRNSFDEAERVRRAVQGRLRQP